MFNETWGPLLTEHSCDHETLPDPLHLHVSGNDQHVAADPANGPVKQICTLQQANSQVHVHQLQDTAVPGQQPHYCGGWEVGLVSRRLPGVTVVWRGLSSLKEQSLTRPSQQTPPCSLRRAMEGRSLSFMGQVCSLVSMKSASWFSHTNKTITLFQHHSTPTVRPLNTMIWWQRTTKHYWILPHKHSSPTPIIF